MRRALGLALALLLAFTTPAFAYQMTLPNTFTNGQVIDANLVMQNLNSIVTTVNTGIDHANVNGTVGFYASDLKPPNTSAATFGGSTVYTFGNGLIVGSGGASVVGMTVNLAASQTADALDVKNSSGTILDSIGATGTLTAPAFVDSGLLSAPCIGTNGSGAFVSAACGTTYTNAAPITLSGSTFGCTTCAVVSSTNVFTQPQTIASSGVGLLIQGNGATGMLELQDTSTTTTAPKKYLRANGGNGKFELVNSAYSAVILSVDDAGNVTATNFFTGSRREWKINVRPYSFSPVALLRASDFKEYDCRSAPCGPTGEHKIGLIANDTPAQIAGAQHDHVDVAALAAIDGAAIVELSDVVRGLCRAPQNRKVKACARAR